MTDQHHPPEAVNPDPPPEPPLADPVPDEQAPQEVEQDAIEELNRIHAAQRFDEPFAQQPALDPTYGMSPPAMGTPMARQPFMPLDEPEVHRRAPEPAMPSTRELRSLDDLYATYPSIGDGSHFLRVERKHPTRYSGQFIAGFLTDLHEQISMSEFARRFGGQVYNVSVCGPGRGSTLDAEGRAQTRTLNTIQLKVPGVPIVDNFGPSNGSGTPMNTYPGSREDARVTMKRMEFEADALRRAEQRNDSLRREVRVQANMSPDMVAQMNEMAEARARETRSTHSEIITDLRDGKKRLEEALRERDQVLDGLRQQLVQTQTEVATRLREEESRQVKELKLSHGDAIARSKEDHAATIQRIQQEHERRIGELTERHSRDMDQIRQTEQRERERLRDDASRREKNLQDDFARREQSFRERERSVQDEFTRREDSVRRDYEMRFQQLERSNKRDLDMIKSSESTKAELATQTAHMQSSLHMQEIARLSQSVESAEASAADTQRELSRFTNKPLLEQVAETKQIAETLGLFDKKEEEFDWKKGAVGAIKDLIGKAPDIAKGLGEAREQNRIAVTRAQHAAHQAQSRAEMQRRRATMHQQQQHGPPQMATDPQQQQQQRHIAPPPPPPGMARAPQVWDAGPPDPGYAGGLPPEPTNPPMAEPRRPAPSPRAGQTSAPARPPITGGPAPTPPQPAAAPPPADAVFSEDASVSPAAAPPPPPPSPSPPVHIEGPPPPPGMSAPQSQPEPSAAAPPEGAIEVTEEQVAKFSEQLEAAIQSGIVSAGTFADGFIEEVGPEVTLAIINAIAPDQLIGAVRAQEGAQSTAIVTREGRKFVHELWGEARTRALAKLGHQP